MYLQHSGVNRHGYKPHLNRAFVLKKVETPKDQTWNKFNRNAPLRRILGGGGETMVLNSVS